MRESPFLILIDNLIKNIYLVFYFIECKNSGQYTDAECDGWKGSCHSDEWQDFMIEHCQETCGFCNTGKYQRMLHVTRSFKK